MSLSLHPGYKSCRLPPPRLAQQLQHALGVALDDEEIGAHAAERPRAALLPVPDLVDGETEGRGEVVLREAGAPADRAHVDLRGNVQPRRLRLPARDGERLGEALGDLLECLLAHFLPLLFFAARATLSELSSARALAIIFSALHSAFDRLDFSPLPNTVSRYTGVSSPE